MITFKEFRQILKENLADEMQYVAWGFIMPDGKLIEKDADDQASEFGGHLYLSQALGYKDPESLIADGGIRWGIMAHASKTMFLQINARKFNEKNKIDTLNLVTKYRGYYKELIVTDDTSRYYRELSNVGELRAELNDLTLDDHRQSNQAEA